MKKMIIPAIFISLMFSCTSKEATEEKKDTITMDNKNIEADSFDLSKINFTENLNTLLNNKKLKLEEGKSDEQTILGYETYTSTSNTLLNFNGKSLIGQSKAGKNQVVIHYAADTKTIGLYELKIYTAREAAELVGSLNKLLGKPNFEKKDSNSNAIELDENGNEVKSSDQTKKSYQVWENSSTGLSYFLIQSGTGDAIYTELTALNKKAKSAKDWIAFRAFDWYKN